ncbi:MAG: folate-binding protein YgfZ [Polyangiaceae bacterium]
MTAWPPQHLPIEARCVFLTRPTHEAFSVRGPDRKSWLNGLLTNNVTRVRPGQAGWGLALTKQGKIQSELWLVESDDELLVFTPPGQASSLVELLDRFLIMEDAELELARDQRLIVLVGPDAQRCAELAPGAWGLFDATGMGGALVAVREDDLAATEARFRDAGAMALEDAAWSALRAERYLPEWGVDYAVESNPHEAGIAHRALGQGPVDWDKGCYLGQEVVCMQDMRGKVRRSLFPVWIEGAALPPSDAEVTDAAGLAVGQLRSRVMAPNQRGVLGFALLKTTALESELNVAGNPTKLLGGA